MLEDTNSLDGAQIISLLQLWRLCHDFQPSICMDLESCLMFSVSRFVMNDLKLQF